VEVRGRDESWWQGEPEIAARDRVEGMGGRVEADACTVVAVLAVRAPMAVGREAG
jgi:hypothetical protein